MLNREEELTEIMKRSEQTRERRSRIKTAVIGTATAFACIVLLVIGVYGNPASGVWTKDNYGAFILEPQSGGYVLTAVIAFLLGASVITALVIYRRKKQRTETAAGPGSDDLSADEEKTVNGDKK